MNHKPDIFKRLLNRRDNTFKKSRQAANDSLKVNMRAKEVFTNTINSTLNNPAISAKRKFSILLRLMKNNKFCNTPPLIENEETIKDPHQKKFQQGNADSGFYLK